MSPLVVTDTTGAIAPLEEGCLQLEEATRYEVPVNIQPRGEKLSAEFWLAMLTEIEEWLPGGTVGVEGARLGAVGNDGVPAAFLAEALLPLIPLLERSLRIVLSQPRKVDAHIWEDVPLRSTRQVNRETLGWISRHPAIAACLDPWAQSEVEGVGQTLPQRITVDSVNHPANRYVSWLVWRVSECLEKTAAALSQHSTAASTNDSAHWCQSRSERALSASRRLRYVWKMSFLKDVHRQPATEAALLVVLDDPAYARLHAVARQFLSPLFSLNSRSESPEAAVRPSFHLYELWCFLAVQKALMSQLDGWKWTHRGLKNLFTLTGSGTGAIYKATHADGRCLTIEFNPVFNGYHVRHGASRWTLSGERRPDIVVCLDNPGGTGRWTCLDAKYRVGRTNLADAFSSVHIYRDALRYEGKGGKCRTAALLAPNRRSETDEWFSEAFFKEFDCGIWAFQPGVEIDKQFGGWIMSSLAG